MEMRQKLLGQDSQKAFEKMQKYTPRLVHRAVENLFGELYGNEVSNLRTGSLCTILLLMTNHMRGALQIGITKEEIGELISQMVRYAGMPAATRPINVLDRILSK